MAYIEPRPINTDEALVLKAVIERASVSDLPMLTPSAICNLVVHSKCECGCGSIGFLPKSVPAPASTQVVADGLGLSPDKKEVDILVYGSEESLVELEVYWYEEGPAPLPDPASIVPWERGAEVKDAVEHHEGK